LTYVVDYSRRSASPAREFIARQKNKSKNLADEYTAFTPADVAAVVHSPEHKSMRIDELDRISRQQHRTWLINAAWSRIV
jgi:hypothetical protein